MKTIHPTRTCFDDALECMELLIKQDKAYLDKLYLVHAICNPADFHRFSHAWLELDDVCIFAGILDGEKHYFQAPKEDYYKEMQIEDLTRYSVMEAAKENFRTNHYGPWKVEYLQLCSDRK